MIIKYFRVALERYICAGVTAESGEIAQDREKKSQATSSYRPCSKLTWVQILQLPLSMYVISSYLTSRILNLLICQMKIIRPSTPKGTRKIELIYTQILHKKPCSVNITY